MMSLPLYCKQHLVENRPCFVYLDDKARKLRCLRANPQGETTIGVSAGGRPLGVDVGATAKERSQRLQHFFRTYCGDPLLWQRRCGSWEVPADVDGGALFKTRPLTRALMERPRCWTSGLESTNPGAAKPAKSVVFGLAAEAYVLPSVVESLRLWHAGLATLEPAAAPDSFESGHSVGATQLPANGPLAVGVRCVDQLTLAEGTSSESSEFILGNRVIAAGDSAI